MWLFGSSVRAVVRGVRGAVGLQGRGEVSPVTPAAARWRRTRQALRFASSELAVVGRRLEEAPNVDSATEAAVDKCLRAHRSTSFAEREAQKARSAGKKPRRTRGQWDILNEAFEKDPRPEEAGLRRLGDEVGITLRQVRTFFQNKRQRHKFTNLEPRVEDARVVNVKTRAAVEAAHDVNAGLQADNTELKGELARVEADLEALVEASNDMVSDLMIYRRISTPSGVPGSRGPRRAGLGSAPPPPLEASSPLRADCTGRPQTLAPWSPPGRRAPSAWAPPLWRGAGSAASHREPPRGGAAQTFFNLIISSART